MQKNNEPEKRAFQSKIEIRSEGEKRRVIGYAALFNKRSVNFGDDEYPMFEIIAPGAFRNVLGDDVRALVDHKGGLDTLARTKSGTLKLSEDEIGLRYEFEAPDTQAGRDLIKILDRGDIDQSSFGFQVNSKGQSFKEREENGKQVLIRTIETVSKLLDVSPVTYPAYPDTMAQARSFDEFRKTQNESELAIENESRDRKIKLAELAN